MTLLRPLWMQASAGDTPDPVKYSALELRQPYMALSGSGSGIFNPTSRVVSHRAAGADMSVDIAAFQAVIAGDDVSGQGAYLVTNTAVYNFSPVPTTPSGSTRVHRLIAQIRDHRSSGTYPAGQYDWVFQLLQDTGGGTPAEPASAMTLALISVSTGQSNVQDSHISLQYPILNNLARLEPQWTAQAANGAWNVTGSWNDYSGGNWSPITFTVPPSGIVRVTIQGGLISGQGFAGIGYKITGTDSVAYNVARCYGINATGTCHGCSTRIIPNLTPGASDTVTPGWYQTNAGNADTGDGMLIVEMIR